MRYSYEPPPSTLDQELIEYLDRQLNKISSSFDSVFVMPVLNELPQRPIEGGLVYVKDDGVYACISSTSNGDTEWKKLVTE